MSRIPGEDDDDAPAAKLAGIPVDIYGPKLSELLGDDEPLEDGSEWLVKGLVAAGVPNVIAGPPKSRKSLLAMHMALCMAAGVQVLGRFATRRARVLFLEREDPLREASRRIWRIARGLGVNPRELDDWLRVDVAKTFRFDDDASVSRLRRTLRAWPSDVVFLDSFRRTHNRDENSASDMSSVTTLWADLSKEFDCAIIPLHHSRKTGSSGIDDATPGTRMRGTGDILAVVRHALGVEAKKANGQLIVTLTPEGNLDGLPEPFSVTVGEDTVDAYGRKTIEFRYLGEAESAAEGVMEAAILIALGEGPMGSRDLRERIKGKGSDVDAAARRLAKLERITRLNDRMPWKLVEQKETP